MIYTLFDINLIFKNFSCHRNCKYDYPEPDCTAIVKNKNCSSVIRHVSFAKSVNFFNPSRVKNRENPPGSTSHPRDCKILTFALLCSFESYFREWLPRIHSLRFCYVTARDLKQNLSPIFFFFCFAVILHYSC